MRKVLVVGAGSTAGFSVVRLLKEGMAHVTAADRRGDIPAKFVADRLLEIDHPRSKKYTYKLVNFCLNKGIDYIIPASEIDLLKIADHQETFNDCCVKNLLPGRVKIDRCNYKPSAYAIAKNCDIAVPEDSETVPCIAKPVRGSGGGGVKLVTSERELGGLKAAYGSDYLYQEVVNGEEYTVDILCDKESRIVAMSTRKRLLVRQGMTVVGETVQVPGLLALCQRFCSAIRMVGACNMQFIQDGSRLVFIEINPRYAAGGLMLSAKAGCNIPLMSLDLMDGVHLGKPTTLALPGVKMIKGSQEFFV